MPAPQPGVAWRCKHGKWRDELDVVVRIEPAAGRDTDRRHSQPAHQRKTLGVLSVPEIVVAKGEQSAGSQWETGDREAQRVFDPAAPEDVLERVVRDGPVHRLVENALPVEHDCDGTERSEKSGAEQSALTQ